MTRRGWRLLAAQLRPHRRALLAFAGLAAALAVPVAVSGLMIARALDEGFLVSRVDLGLLWLAFLAQVWLAGAALTRALFAPLTRIVEPLRDQLVAAVVMAGLDQALREEGSVPGASVLQATDEAELVRRLVASILRNIHVTASAAVGGLIGLAVLDPVVALLVLPCVGASGAVYLVLIRLTLRWQQQAILVEEDLVERAARVFKARRDIVACAAEHTALQPVRAAIRTTQATSLRLAKLGALRMLTAGLGTDVATLLILATAPALLSAGRLSSGDMVGAVFYVTFGLGPAVRFLVHGSAGWLVNLLSLTSRLSDVIDTAPPAAEGTRSVTITITEPGITLERVTFAYSPIAAPVLDDVSLEIPYGAHVAIVGPSGAGKSTLATLVCGQRSPNRGIVRIGGADVADLPSHQRFQTVVLVPQEAYVFGGTVRDNLRYLNPDLPDRQLLDAARQFGMDNILDRYGLDGELPPGGGGLSAGERQLIALVRTYLSAAPVVVLDEATSHLDPPTEQRAESLFARRNGTLVVIAHRISSAQRAERVFLVQSDHLTTGTHDSLLVVSTRYRELVGHWDTQPEFRANGHMPVRALVRQFPGSSRPAEEKTP